MALEIERKFMVDGDAWRAGVETSRSIVQAYIAVDGDTSVRVRITGDEQALLTVKLGVSDMTRHEFEYPVPLADARTMVAACDGRTIEKIRHIIPVDGHVWEVDVFSGALSGLVIAEVEMQSESDAPTLPQWLGREITGDPAWTNAMLAIRGRPEDTPR